MSEDELRALIRELWEYTMRLEGAYSVWHGSRPSIAPWPEVATDLHERLTEAVGEDLAETRRKAT